MWPHAPVEVRQATTGAALYDLGPYPALGEGDDSVLGELWLVREEHLSATLRVLDKIECFGQGGVDLYIRRIVECHDMDGSEHRAHTYFYADEDALRQAQRITADADGYCRWAAA